MTIYILSYTDYCNDNVCIYFPTKKEALEHVAWEKARFPTSHGITNVEVSPWELGKGKAAIAAALNDVEGNGH